jgi:hypothetical protein
MALAPYSSNLLALRFAPFTIVSVLVSIRKMLPDFLKFKTLIAPIILASRPNDPLLSQIGKVAIHEGDRRTTWREDGSFETATYTEYSYDVNIDLLELNEKGDGVLDTTLAKLHESSRVAQQQELFRVVEESTEQAGTVMDAGGRQLTAELILELWETLQFSFDKRGRWKKPQLTCHPVQVERARQEFARLETEPDLKNRVGDLVERKRREWNARQANRKLVD